MYRRNLRLAAITAPPLAVVALAMLACTDTPTSSRPEPADDWADASAVSIAVKTSAITRDGFTTLLSQERVEEAPVIEAFSSTPPSARSEKPRLSLTSFRGVDGRSYTVAAVPDESGAPVKRIYFFVDGHPFLVSSPKYARRGSGWQRTALRMTTLDENGRVVHQADWRVTGSAPNAAGIQVRAVGDATRTYVEEQTEDEDPCKDKLDAFKSKTAAAAVASVLFTAAVYACFKGDLDACARVPSLSGPLLVAAQAATDAWKAYQDCKNSQPKLPSTIVGGGEETWGPIKDDDLMTVDEFIARAEAAGTYYCSDGGESCVFFAAS